MKRADPEKRCGSLVKTETDCALKVLKRNVLLYPKKRQTSVKAKIDICKAPEKRGKHLQVLTYSMSTRDFDIPEIQYIEINQILARKARPAFNFNWSLLFKI